MTRTNGPPHPISARTAALGARSIRLRVALVAWAGAVILPGSVSVTACKGGGDQSTMDQVRAGGNEGSEAEREAAELVVTYLEDREHPDETLLAKAKELLATLEPQRGLPAHREFLHWLVRYLAAGPGAWDPQTPTPLYSGVLRAAAAGDAAVARTVLGVFFLGAEESSGVDSFGAFARELVVCSFPGRTAAEDPGETIAFMGLQPGDAVADVGSGPGYFTYPFAEAVGERGKAYAIEANDFMLRFVTDYAKERGLQNVVPVRGDLNDITLPEGTLDHAFMTHMFVDIDIYYDAEHRQSLFGSVHRALRPGGCFTVCEPAAPGRRNMTADQLDALVEEYGFRDDQRAPAGTRLATFNCVRVKRP